ncbi:MAG: hypothetical protein ACTSYI_14545 [Promethearchaeota archaeon]
MGIGNVITILPLIAIVGIFTFLVYWNNRNSIRNRARYTNMPNEHADSYSGNSEYSNYGSSNYGSQQTTPESSQNSYTSAASTPKYCVSCGNQLPSSGSSFCQYCGEKNDY